MFGWFGEVGGTRKNHTHRCVSSFYYLVERKVRNITKISFRVFNTCSSSPILLFCPRNPKSFFLENPKRRAPENDRDLSYQKLIWSHMMPFGVNSDPSFRAQKRSIRVRVSSFRTAGTVQKGAEGLCTCTETAPVWGPAPVHHTPPLRFHLTLWRFQSMLWRSQ